VRALATLVAVLVGLSSLGQFAHFLLVAHAGCPEHGELLELGEQTSHAEAHGSSEESDAAQLVSAPSAEHDHCQVLARGQREQAEPTPATVVVLSTSAGSVERLAPITTAICRKIPALSLAPKTSPPFALVG
jgi:hypothetical protein